MVSKKWNGYGVTDALELRSFSPEVIEKVQLTFLRKHLLHASQVPFYSDLLKSCEFVSDSEMGLDQILQSLPLTARVDLDQQHDKFGLNHFKPIHDVALTSGTTGTSVVVPYTESDLARLAFNEAVSFYSAGVRQNSKVLLTVTLDRCFIAGLAYYSGVTFLGATAIRSGPGQPARQWEVIKRLQPDVIVGVPTFLLELGRWAQKNNIEVAGSSVDTIITIGEPARRPDCSPTPVGVEIANMWKAKIYSSYGATEFETAFGECSAGQGGHVHPELMIAEIIDDNGNVVADGERGEVVVTPLGVEGFPLVRFRTGDIARMYSNPCSCGWNTKRLGPIEGRLAQRLKYRGTTIYPESIFHVLQDLESVSASYVEVCSAADGADDVVVVVGSDDSGLYKKDIESLLQARLRVTPAVQINNRQAVLDVMNVAGSHKPKKFFDYRK